MNDATITGGAYVSPNPTAGWKIVGVADFNFLLGAAQALQIRVVGVDLSQGAAANNGAAGKGRG